LVQKWRPIFWTEEHGQIISGVGPFLERREQIADLGRERDDLPRFATALHLGDDAARQVVLMAAGLISITQALSVPLPSPSGLFVVIHLGSRFAIHLREIRRREGLRLISR
jgi:hypothetical protein